MEFDQTAIQVLYAFSILTSIVVCVVVWRHREKTGGVALFCYVVSGLIWSGSLLANVTVDQAALSSFFARSVFVGVGLGAASVFVFALEYTGREHLVRKETIALLSVHPVLVTVFAMANPGNYFFESIGPDPVSLTGVLTEVGIGWWIHTGYSYALVLVSTALFVDLHYRSRSLSRRQTVALVGGAVMPGAATVLSIAGLVSFNIAPVGIAIASVLFTIAIVRYRLIDIVPIARDRVLENVTDGVFVVDREGRLIDVNSEGRRMVAGADDDLIGRHVETFFDDSAVRDWYVELTADRSESDRELTVGDRHYSVRATPIDDGRGRHVGWLFLVRDVTERHRRERRLERQNERLEGFADLVSHDLRNPLNVADGYLDLARDVTDDGAYLDEIERSHDRMEAIIEDILALAREGENVTDPVPVGLADIATRAWNNVDTGDATLEVRSSVTILADPDRTTRLLENLFRNSVEHSATSSRSGADGVEPGSTADGSSDTERGRRSTCAETDAGAAVESDEPDRPAGGGLEVSVGTLVGDGRDVEGFWVEDDGPGIPEDDRDRVFEQGFTTEAEGTGFGLSIVQQIAAAHGWSIAAVEGDAGGARFAFTGVETVDDEDRTRSAP